MQREVVKFNSADLCWMVGPNYQIQREAKIMQRRGEIDILGRAVRFEGLKPGQVAIPYRRLMTARRARVRHAQRRLILWGSIGFVYVLSMAALAWESRYLLMQVGGFLLFLAGCWTVFRFVAGHSAGCTGLHCPGCRG